MSNEDWSFLDEMNMTELVRMARESNANVHRSIPREILYEIIMGEEVALPQPNMDTWRHTIFSFVDSHWKQVNPLLSCPMKTRSPTACFQCPDIQVAECVVESRETLLTPLRKKPTT